MMWRLKVRWMTWGMMLAFVASFVFFHAMGANHALQDEGTIAWIQGGILVVLATAVLFDLSGD